MDMNWGDFLSLLLRSCHALMMHLFCSIIWSHILLKDQLSLFGLSFASTSFLRHGESAYDPPSLDIDLTWFCCWVTCSLWKLLSRVDDLQGLRTRNALLMSNTWLMLERFEHELGLMPVPSELVVGYLQIHVVDWSWWRSMKDIHVYYGKTKRPLWLNV